MEKDKKRPIINLKQIPKEGLTEKLQDELRRAEITKREGNYGPKDRPYDLSSAPSYGDIT